MRFVKLTTYMSVTLVTTWLTLAGGVAMAAENKTLAPEDQAFLTRAMSDDAAQIAMSQMALKKSTNPQVLALANAVIQERSALDNQIAGLLGASGQREAAKHIASSDSRLGALQSLSGDAFDKTFAGMLVGDHYHIISAYESIKATTAHIGLQNIAREALPALRGNLTIALTYLRSANWKPTSHPETLVGVDSRSSKVPVYWEPISIVAAPW